MSIGSASSRSIAGFGRRSGPYDRGSGGDDVLCAALDRGAVLARYNAVGLQALGDLRRNNGARPSVLKPELLAKLKVRLEAGELGVAKVGVQRGWEALKGIGKFKRSGVHESGATSQQTSRRKRLIKKLADTRQQPDRLKCRAEQASAQLR
jgi:hypothetical protein